MSKLFKLLVTFQFLLILDCVSQQSHRYVDNSIKVDSNNVPLSGATFYFPTKLFPEIEMDLENGIFRTKNIRGTVDSLHLTWYSKFLYAMNEPLLFNRRSNKTVYRFTWLRSFHAPIVIRLEKDRAGAYLYYKVTNGLGGYEPGIIVINRKQKIPESEWRRFLSLIKSTGFWKWHTIGCFGEDGAEWILEGVEPTKYHAVSAWVPGNHSDFYRVCEFLLGLTDLQIPQNEKY